MKAKVKTTERITIYPVTEHWSPVNKAIPLLTKLEIPSAEKP